MKTKRPFLRSPVLFFSALLLALGGCSKDDQSGGEITLIAPEDGAIINFMLADEAAFSWEAVAGVDGPFSITFSTAANQAGVTLPAGSNPLTLDAATLSAGLGELDVTAGVRTPVYWSVSAAGATSAPRLANITRRPDIFIKLLSPADGATVDLASGTGVTFAWTVTPAGSRLTALLGQQADLSDGIPVDIGTQGSPYVVPADMFALLNEALQGYGGVDVKPGQTYALYWTLIPADAQLSRYPANIRRMNVKTRP
jgi:hypothetical protein